MKKPLSGAARQARSDQRKRDAGLIQIKVWVADQRKETDPDVTIEAVQVRKYAAKQPKTKAIFKALKK